MQDQINSLRDVSNVYFCALSSRAADGRDPSSRSNNGICSASMQVETVLAFLFSATLKEEQVDVQGSHPAVVVLVDPVFGEVTARSTVRWQVRCLWVVLLNELGNLFVGEVASSDKESLVCCCIDFDGLDVGKCHISHVNPNESA